MVILTNGAYQLLKKTLIDNFYWKFDFLLKMPKRKLEEEPEIILLDDAIEAKKPEVKVGIKKNSLDSDEDESDTDEKAYQILAEDDIEGKYSVFIDWFPCPNSRLLSQGKKMRLPSLMEMSLSLLSTWRKKWKRGISMRMVTTISIKIPGKLKTTGSIILIGLR